MIPTDRNTIYNARLALVSSGQMQRKLEANQPCPHVD